MALILKDESQKISLPTTYGNSKKWGRSIQEPEGTKRRKRELT